MQDNIPHNELEESTHMRDVVQNERSTSAEDGIDLLKVLSLFWLNRRIILSFALGAGVISAMFVYLVMKPKFTAQAVFLAPQMPPGSAMSQLAGQLGAFGGFAGMHGTGDIYVGILGSRTIADSLIKRFDLQKMYKVTRESDAEKILQAQSKFTAGKNSLITISVTTTDRRLAADLANGYLDALHEQSGKLALTESSQRRAFFEQQLVHEKDALADAEVELKKTQEQTGLIAPVGQTTVALELMQALRAQIASRQVELGVLTQGATENNPAVIRAKTEIARLQGQLYKLENDSSRRRPGSTEAPAAKVPELALEYVRKEREVKYHETLFELLSKQYETARLDESRDAPLLQVLDRAVVPDRKSGPPRVLLTIAGVFAGFVIGTLSVFSKQILVGLETSKLIEALEDK